VATALPPETRKKKKSILPFDSLYCGLITGYGIEGVSSLTRLFFLNSDLKRYIDKAILTTSTIIIKMIRCSTIATKILE
jgi:hypothetical protein